MTTITLNVSPATFPLVEMISGGLWAALSPAARAVLGVIWDYHRKYPDACHPNRTTLAKEAGVSEPTVTRAVKELEATGLLQVMPATGPSANTYRLDWTRISIPSRGKSKTVDGTPYAGPGGQQVVTLIQDEHGREKVARDRRGHVHTLPDGCNVRSAAEVAIHSYLVEWKIPHWCNVPYKALGVRGLHPEATVDFVVGPGVLVEHFGLPRLQSQAAKYNKKRNEKVLAIKKAGWVLITLEPGETLLTEDHLKLILDVWAVATVKQAEGLKRRLDEANCWKGGHPSCQFLDQHLADAQLRHSGAIPPRSPVGLYKVAPGRFGVDSYVRVVPEIVLDVQAGRRPAPSPLPAVKVSQVAPSPSAPAGPDSFQFGSDAPKGAFVAPSRDDSDYTELGDTMDYVDVLRAEIYGKEIELEHLEEGTEEHADLLAEIAELEDKIRRLLDRDDDDDE